MTSMGLAFLSPAWLWLLPALALITLLWKKSADRQDESSQPVSFISPSADLRVRLPLLARLQIEQRALIQSHALDMIVTVLVLSSLVLALAQPVKTGSRIPDQPNQRDITFIVDASVSMLLRDYILDGKRIDRMSFLKSFLDRFVQRLEGDRISVIVFGESAYTFIPLNDDQSLTRRLLSRLKTTMAGRFNALGEAIALAVKQAGDDSDRRRLLILFTDTGDSTDSISPITAAKLAKESGLPMYTIAIGAAGYDAAEDELAGLIYHPADIKLLKKMAELTGAKSYQAGDEKTLEDAIQDIDLREKYKKELPPRYFSIPLYPIPLIFSLLILSIYQFYRLSRSIIR
ncbi:MAG TPA: VWA domain-containing protein [Gammaproteobacteria bacterium]|nr:VWA domain-containing protein [Gammaproteobacteria bacterium]